MNIQPIDERAIRQVVHEMEEALRREDPASRHEAVGRAVRSVTRIWADANPDFDGDAWYPISYLLTEHWDQINRHMTEAGDGS